MTDSERIDFLIGQVAALKAFSISLIIREPDPRALLQLFDRGSEHTIAKTLPTKASEAMLQGMEDIRHALTHVLSSEAEKRTGV